jgi:chromatin remodeling complex protein RSC6
MSKTVLDFSSKNEVVSETEKENRTKTQDNNDAISNSKLQEHVVDQEVKPAIDTNGDETIETQFTDIIETLGGMKQYITQVQNKIRVLEKQVKKTQKTQLKQIEKRNRGNKKPSGFAKPAAVSDELCCFMNRKKGTHLARTEVTQYIISYIKEKQLQDRENKRRIVPNDSLKKLLGVNEKDEVTYFTLQQLMNRHFI